ncbi:MAG TPA: SprB repeat-containing protein [Chitinophagaceae bacterium]|nr:SprB repeat-containing protein [Chitinophagaceae bacterium]
MKKIISFFLFTTLVYSIHSCSKGGGGSTPPPTDPCIGAVTLTTSVVNASSGQSNGSITASATGGSGFTYSINNGAFQSAALFINLAAGTYTITAKNSAGCTASAQAIVGTATVNTACVGTPGPLFTAVKNLLAANCTSCHNNAQQEGGMNWTVDCNIVSFKDRIKARAVDANPSQMPPPPNPPLSAADKKKITDWIAAGGTITN